MLREVDWAESLAQFKGVPYQGSRFKNEDLFQRKIHTFLFQKSFLAQWAVWS